MTPKQTRLVQDTWRQILPSAEIAADRFYSRLFALDPASTTLFQSTDLPAQKAKLLQTLAVSIANLHAIEPLMHDLTELGRRHAHYGVTADDYQAVGAALLWALDKGLGDAWTKEVQGAWAAAYALITKQMIAGTEAARADKDRRAAVN